jgi:hypothetical protein
LTASAVASFLAAVSGVLFAYKNVDFSQVGLEASRGLQVLALAYLGGVGSVAGAIIAGVLTPAGLFAEVTGTQGSSTEQFLITGIGLIVVATRLPGGIAGAGPWLAQTAARLRRRGGRPTRLARPGEEGLPSVQVIEPSSTQLASRSATHRNLRPERPDMAASDARTAKWPRGTQERRAGRPW